MGLGHQQRMIFTQGERLDLTGDRELPRNSIELIFADMAEVIPCRVYKPVLSSVEAELLIRMYHLDRCIKKDGQQRRFHEV